MNTVHSWPDLFKIMTPVKVDVLESMLEMHPNCPYVESVLWSLRNGFWPWATPGEERYPEL